MYYAKQVMVRYDDRVPYWVTINEPNQGFQLLYRTFTGMTQSIFAHAALYDWYKHELQGTGKITIKLASNVVLPLDPNNTSHVAAADRYNMFYLGVSCNPLLLGKQFPHEALETPYVDLRALTKEQLSSLH